LKKAWSEKALQLLLFINCPRTFSEQMINTTCRILKSELLI
jgi:hypothetical protein